MRIAILLAALAAIAGPAAAEDFPVVVKAYEAKLSELRLPGNSNGTLSFRSCSECEYQTVRVTASTIYEANGQRYLLEDFRNELASIGGSRQTAVTVKHHLESDTIAAVRVTTY